MQKTVVVRAAVFRYLRKIGRGVSTPPPPIRARVKENYCNIPTADHNFLNVWCKCTYWPVCEVRRCITLSNPVFCFWFLRRVVRYEDFSLQLSTSVPALLQFMGLQYHPTVQGFVKTHTKFSKGGASRWVELLLDNTFWALIYSWTQWQKCCQQMHRFA